MGLLQPQGWLVLRSTENEGQDLLSFNNETVGSVLWLRELRYPAICRSRMTDGLNCGLLGIHNKERTSWSLSPVGVDLAALTSEGSLVWAVLHNGEEMGELRWFADFTGTIPHPNHGFLHGLNMVAGGRHPFACEPMPLTRPHLRLVR